MIYSCDMAAARDVLWDKPETEYLDGRAFPKVSPRRTHGLVQLAASIALMRCAGSRGQVATEWEFDIGGADGTFTRLVPDVAYVSMERLRALPPEQREIPPFAPDIAIEVRSPSFHEALLRDKVRKYLGTGAILVLDIDPATRGVTAYTAHGRSTTYADSLFRSEAVPWLEFPAGELFAALDALD